MNETLIIGVILIVSWIGLLFLRVPSSIAFLSLLIGQLLSNQASDDLFNFVAGIAHMSKITYVQIALLLVPLGLTLLFMRNRVSKSKRYIEALPILFVAALAILLVAPLLPALQSILDIATRDQLAAYKSIIVIAASISGLLSAWLSYPKPVSLKTTGKSKKHHA